jgi:hypothetical protein
MVEARFTRSMRLDVERNHSSLRVEIWKDFGPEFIETAG